MSGLGPDPKPKAPAPARPSIHEELNEETPVERSDLYQRSRTASVGSGNRQPVAAQANDTTDHQRSAAGASREEHSRKGKSPGSLKTPHAPFGSRAVRSHERYSWLSVARRCSIAPKICYLRPWSLPRCRTLVSLCGASRGITCRSWSPMAPKPGQTPPKGGAVVVYTCVDLVSRYSNVEKPKQRSHFIGVTSLIWNANKELLFRARRTR